VSATRRVFAYRIVIVTAWLAAVCSAAISSPKNRQRSQDIVAYGRRWSVLPSYRTELLVLWPGLGNSCWNRGLADLIDEIRERYGTIDVHCVDVGYGGLFGDVESQIDDVCEQLRDVVDSKHPPIKVSYLGLSQGGLFLRAMLQRCDLPAGALVTLGSPHAGVSSWPSCPVDVDVGSESWFCTVMDRLVIQNLGTAAMIRRTIVPASYLTDDEAPAPFLATANSCRDSTIGGLHALKFKAEKFVSFAFEYDDMLEPPTSAWFWHVDHGRVVPAEQQPELHCLRDGLDYEQRTIPGAAHMQIDADFFFLEIVERYFVGRVDDDDDDGGHVVAVT